MSIGLGVYDIFSRIVPGGFYLFVFIQFTNLMGWSKYDLTVLNNLDLVPSLVLAAVAYILGTAMDRVGSAWQKIFEKHDMSNHILHDFKTRNAKYWTFEFDEKDWPILRAYIRIHNPELVHEADKHNALSIMLRNLSLGLVLLAISKSIQILSTKNWGLVILVIALIFFSYQLAISARTLRQWFYSVIFETIIAYRLDLEKRIKPVKRRAQRD